MARKRSRKKHSRTFKAKVAVEAIKGVKTVPEIAKRRVPSVSVLRARAKTTR